MSKNPTHSSRLVRAFAAAFLVSAVVAGTALAVTRHSAKPAHAAAAVVPAPDNAVADDVAQRAATPVAVPKLKAYHAPKMKHFKKPAPRVVVRPQRVITIVKTVRTASAPASTTTKPSRGDDGGDDHGDDHGDGGGGDE